MEKGNVLVIGNSGVGKSTLINAVLGDDVAVTGWGSSGTTKELCIYENDGVPFRVIDSVGFEPSYVKEKIAVNAVKKWSKNSANEASKMNRINVVWFCIDGTSRKLFAKTIRNLTRATSIWKSVPVIVVITKSYSIPERKENVEMVYNAFANQKSRVKNLRKVIPVVAAPYVLNASSYAPPDGITELIDATNELMPEGIKAGEQDIEAFTLNRKRALAHSITGIATAAGVVVGAVPIPIADALILAPIETTEINSIARIYGIGKDEKSKLFLNSIIEVGTVGAAAKIAISALKAIPFVNLGASIINAIIAGTIIAVLGEGSIYTFEQISAGKKSVEDIDWAKDKITSMFSSKFLETIETAAKKLTENADSKTITKMITDVIKK